MKKHIRHISNAEREFLYGLIRNVKDWQFTKYAFKRVDERLVTEQDALLAIGNGLIVEYHGKDGEHRVLLRGTNLIDKKYVVCVVVAPAERRVVTVYVNEAQDRHFTLDWSKYNKNINILKEMGAVV